jgi:hypothetical protein
MGNSLHSLRTCGKVALARIHEAGVAPMTPDKADALAARITGYLASGGLWNPELMEHDKVLDLLVDCREALTSTQEQLERCRTETLEEAARVCDQIHDINGMEAGLGAACATAIRSLAKPIEGGQGG